MTELERLRLVWFESFKYYNNLHAPAPQKCADGTMKYIVNVERTPAWEAYVRAREAYLKLLCKSRGEKYQPLKDDPLGLEQYKSLHYDR